MQLTSLLKHTALMSRPHLRVKSSFRPFSGRGDMLGIGRPPWPRHTPYSKENSSSNSLLHGSQHVCNPFHLSGTQAFCHSFVAWGQQLRKGTVSKGKQNWAQPIHWARRAGPIPDTDSVNWKAVRVRCWFTIAVTRHSRLDNKFQVLVGGSVLGGVSIKHRNTLVALFATPSATTL